MHGLGGEEGQKEGREGGKKEGKKEWEEGKKEWKEGKKEWKEGREGQRDGGRQKGRKERRMYACSGVCYCKTKHATVGLLGLFKYRLMFIKGFRERVVKGSGLAL